MNNLIPLQQDEKGRQLVNARELHAFLQSKQEFTHWINNRVKKYGFTEGYDYLINLSNRVDGKAGKPRTEYQLTLDMAKELSMVENNERGKQARRYFIQCEKELRISQELGNADTQLRLADLILKNSKEIHRLRQDFSAMQKSSSKQVTAPKKQPNEAIGHTGLKDTEVLMSVKDFAFMLQDKGIDTGPNRFFEYLRQHGYLRHTGPNFNAPTPKAKKMGLFNESDVWVNVKRGTVSKRHVKMLTAKGISYFSKKFMDQ